MKRKSRNSNGASASSLSPASTTNSNRTANNFSPAHAEVAGKAYLIYVQQGCVHGHDVQHWLEAEAQTAATPTTVRGS